VPSILNAQTDDLQVGVGAMSELLSEKDD